ncbi:TetR/AcrR family transcriptional regulator [Nocardioides mangrovi]|uniref:TetR/AcrR family transcriptional regulator n=1 Tax=Nocardioides mangrovi TaxID=2874580 RepID=A0ABS7UDV8_9ACTN|nr:TetR/AcrR family transcriptional regulator [Nocardioides mangrovi]MBZ5739188.1 TetR/AcrR family transcriptional regulator [Nocardioides mangrovi]
MTTEPARRPGRRLDLDVPETVISVAERMFGEASIDSVSLRSVAREAGVAPAAVTYHFPSKHILVAAVVERRSREVGRTIRDRLTALLEQPAPGVRDLVDAILEPMVAVVDGDPVGGLHWMKIIARLAVTDDPAFYDGVQTGRDLNVLFGDASAATLGERTPVVGRRTGLAIFGMLTALAGADLVGYDGAFSPETGLDPDFVEQLAVFTAAGLAAGLTSP